MQKYQGPEWNGSEMKFPPKSIYDAMMDPSSM